MKITEYCTGCRTCEQLCSQNAIYIATNNEGFWEAIIDKNLCIDCGLCQKRCPQNTPTICNYSKQVLAVRLKDDKILINSASGGAFAGIAKAWIEEGGIVVGVVFDKEWNAHHICTNSIDELKQLQSSKYVQADTRNTYLEVKNYLDKGKKVLYSGTGCQIAGLKSFLKKEYDNLLTMDLICHGVASPLLFKKYIQWLGEKEGSPIKEYDFRDKKGGWGLGYKYKYKNKYRYKSCTIDPYYFRFLQGDTYNEACYKCNYSKKERIGDITIGDYWGIEKEHPNFFNQKGVSCLLINSEKGFFYWEKYKNLYFYITSKFENVAKHNLNLIYPTKRNDVIRDSIYKGIENKDWFCDTFVSSFHPSIKTKMKNFIPMKIRYIIKKIKILCIK